MHILRNMFSVASPLSPDTEIIQAKKQAQQAVTPQTQIKSFIPQQHMEIQQPENYEFFHKVKDNITHTHIHLKDLPLIDIVKNIRTSLAEDNQVYTESELADFIYEAIKVDQIAKGFWVKGGLIAVLDDRKQFHLHRIEHFVASGAVGRVFGTRNMISGESDGVVKKLNPEKEDFAYQLQHEYDMLTEIHKNGHVTGIQRAPYAVLHLSDNMNSPLIGYLAPRYDFDLKDQKFLEKWPADQKLQGYQSLIEGLLFLHKHGIVHGDIKLENCCSDKGELQLADFGGAEKLANINANDAALRTMTLNYYSDIDMQEYNRLKLAYNLNQFITKLERNEAPIDAEDIEVLKSLLNNKDFSLIDQEKQIIRSSIAFILQKNHQSLNGYEREAEELSHNPKDEEQIKKDLSFLSRYQSDNVQLTLQARNLCKSQDVFALGKVMLEGLSGNIKIAIKDMPKVLASLSERKDLSKVNPELTDLLKAMVAENPAKRISLKEVKERYQVILQKINQEKVLNETKLVNTQVVSEKGELERKQASQGS